MTNEQQKLDELAASIDQLAADARDCGEQIVQNLLDLAWWFAENAYRLSSGGSCTVRCKAGEYCSVCSHYNKLAPAAARFKRTF